MTVNFKAILLYASPYSMEDEKTKEKREGISIIYYGDASLVAKEDEEGGRTRGEKPYNATLPINLMGNIDKVPAIYEFDAEMRGKKNVNGGNNAVLTPVNLKFVSECLIVTD